MSSPEINSESPFTYEDRYGIKPAPRWRLFASVVAVIGISWTVWAGLDYAEPAIRSTLFAISVTGEREITVRYSIDRKDPNVKVICTLVAYDFDKNIVGEIDDQFLPGAKSIQRATPIPARAPAVSAAISRCRTA